MKWTNKGHELDSIGEKLRASISQDPLLCIYGAGVSGAWCMKILSLIGFNAVYVDSNVNKQKSGIEGNVVIAPEALYAMEREHIVIITISGINREIVEKKLLLRGYTLGKNLFDSGSFLSVYLPIYEMYVHNKLFLKDITLVITEKCTLKCEKCAPMFSYLKNPHTFSFEEVKKNIDELWSKVDFICDLIITGGEPLLNPELYSIIEYLLKNYGDRFGCLQIITNGTLIPQDDLLVLFTDSRIKITVSDYTKTNACLLKRIDEVLEKLNQHHIIYEVQKADKWVDFGFSKEDRHENADSLPDFFDNCASPCRGFINGKIVYCTPARYAGKALDMDKAEDDNSFWGNNRMEILEYSMGYQDKGYMEVCQKCNGYMTVNTCMVEPAAQMKNK